MTRTILIGYLAKPWGGHPSGLRVWTDGLVEIGQGASSWREVARLDPEQMEQLEAYVRQSHLLDMPSEVPAPPGLSDGANCDWEANLDGKEVQVLVHGWSDANLQARPLRSLVMQMYGLIAAAQNRPATNRTPSTDQ